MKSHVIKVRWKIWNFEESCLTRKHHWVTLLLTHSLPKVLTVWNKIIKITLVVCFKLPDMLARGKSFVSFEKQSRWLRTKALPRAVYEIKKKYSMRWFYTEILYWLVWFCETQCQLSTIAVTVLFLNGIIAEGIVISIDL